MNRFAHAERTSLPGISYLMRLMKRRAKESAVPLQCLDEGSLIALLNGWIL